jgi:hypothetical protein
LQSNQCVVFDFSLLDESVVHAHLVARCISYLAHDIPKQPLEATQLLQLQGSSTGSEASLRTMQTQRSGDSGFYSQPSSDEDAPMENTPDKPDIESIFPLLRYAVLCWPVHLSRSLSLSSAVAQNGHSSSSYPAAQSSNHMFSASTISESHLGWVPVLSQFLLDRLAVTAWVESSWSELQSHCQPLQTLTCRRILSPTEPVSPGPAHGTTPFVYHIPEARSPRIKMGASGFQRASRCAQRAAVEPSGHSFHQTITYMAK